MNNTNVDSLNTSEIKSIENQPKSDLHIPCETSETEKRKHSQLSEPSI